MYLQDTSVAFVRLEDYSPCGLEQSVDRLLSLHLGSRRLGSLKVLLKPNLISSSNNGLPCTEPAVIVATAKWFLDRGAHVAVGDSPAFGSAEAVLSRIGALPELNRLGVPVREFSTVEEVALVSGKRVGIAVAAKECDLLVNLPRVKAHAQAKVTLAVKNLFGCVVGMRKPWWHMVHGGAKGNFCDLLVQLVSVLPEGVTLLDGIRAMNRTGPINGLPIDLGILGSSVNPFAMDTAVLELLGIELASCPLWCAAKRVQQPGFHPADLDYLTGRNIGRITGFEVPDKLMPIRFNPFRFVKNSILRVVSARIG